MANYTAYVQYLPSRNVYAKPRPINASPWSTGVINFTANGTTGEYSATLDDDLNYVVYERLGGSPASSDLAFWDQPKQTQTLTAAERQAISGQIAADNEAGANGWADANIAIVDNYPVQIAANAISAGVLDASAVTEIQSGLATSTQAAAIQAKTDLITAGGSGIVPNRTYRWRNVNHGQNYDDVRIEELP